MTASIYLIKAVHAGQPVKIGWSTNVRKRLNSLQIGNPVQLGIAYERRLPSIAAAASLEATLHELWAKNRIRGEWFDIDWTYPLASIFDLCEPENA